MRRIFLAMGAVYGGLLTIVLSVLNLFVWTNVPLTVVCCILWVVVITCWYLHQHLPDNGG